MAVKTPAPGATERLLAFASQDEATRAVVIAHFCRPDPEAFPDDPCVLSARAQAAEARNLYAVVVEAAAVTDGQLVAAALAWRFNAHSHCGGAAMFPIGCKVNHSCDPNMR